jgi:hypothetical protein
VALLAAQDLVAAREREAGQQVIEAFRSGRLGSRGAWCERRRDADHQQCADPCLP